jgi:hypothetical protein
LLLPIALLLPLLRHRSLVLVVLVVLVMAPLCVSLSCYLYGTPAGGVRPGYKKFGRDGLVSVTGLPPWFGGKTAAEVESSSTRSRMVLLEGMGGE